MLSREVMLQLFPKSTACVDLYLPLVQAVTRQVLINTPDALLHF